MLNQIAIYRKKTLIANVPYNDVAHGDWVVISMLVGVPTEVKRAIMDFAAKRSTVDTMNGYIWCWKGG
jgi:hypothetical protein